MKTQMKDKPFEERQKQSARLIATNPDRIPIVVNKHTKSDLKCEEHKTK